MKLTEALFRLPNQIFLVDPDHDDDFTEWILRPLVAPTLSAQVSKDKDGNGFFLVQALSVQSDGSTQSAYIDVSMPERVIDYSYHLYNGIIEQRRFAEGVIPAIGIEALGNYEEYYVKKHPEIGLQVLRDALKLAQLKWPIAMELGYIFRDEGRFQDALDAFAIVVQEEPDFAAAFFERSYLFAELGNRLAAQKEWEGFLRVATPAERSLYGKPPGL